MSLTPEQIAVAGKIEMEHVLQLIGLKHKITVHAELPPELEAKADQSVWYLEYRIYVAGHVHSGKHPVACKMGLGDKVKSVDMREPAFKNALGDLGRGILDLIRVDDAIVWVHDACWVNDRREILTLGGVGEAICAICGGPGTKCKDMSAIWGKWIKREGDD